MLGIFFAAPFISFAALFFLILSSNPRGRRWAIPIPTGIVALGLCLILALLAVAGLSHVVAPLHAWSGWYAGVWLAIGGVAAIAGGVLAAILARMAARVLPSSLLRVAVFVAAWCTYFVFIAGSLLLVNTTLGAHQVDSTGAAILAFSLEGVLSLIAAFFVAQRSEDFRPAPDAR